MTRDDWEPDDDEFVEADEPAEGVCNVGADKACYDALGPPLISWSIFKASNPLALRRKRKIVLCGLAAWALMGLIPPWNVEGRRGDVHWQGSASYSAIFWPPHPEVGFGAWDVSIDVVRLVVQAIVILAATLAALLLVNDSKVDQRAAADTGSPAAEEPGIEGASPVPNWLAAEATERRTREALKAEE